MVKWRSWPAALALCWALTAGTAAAGIDLVTLPGRDTVQLTIYNSADLTLVRDQRTLTLAEGENRLHFSWANTLIDPTSLQLLFPEHAGRVVPAELSYPPRVRDLGAWRVRSGVSGRVPAEIAFFTSGISWHAYYLATLAADESAMELACFVRADNRSGEDYENARVRLVVGTISLVDEIAALAKRYPPHGRPDEPRPPREPRPMPMMAPMREEMARAVAFADAMEPREIIREGLSEYFIYTIDGEENIPDGWGKRLPAFSVARVPVVNTFRFEEERYGDRVIRFLAFENDEAHRLGDEPLPDGLVKVFQSVGEVELRYLGADNIRYIPVGQKAELNLGAVRDVEVEAVLAGTATQNYEFDGNGNISGWDDINDYRLKLANYRRVPARVLVRRNQPHQYWEIEHSAAAAEYGKVDLDTVEFSVMLEPGETREITYRVRLWEGTRRQRR